MYQVRSYEDSRSDTALHPGAVKCNGKLHARHIFDLLRNLLGFCSLLNQYSLDSWEKLLGELQSGCEEVGNHNGGTTCSVGSKKSD